MDNVEGLYFARPPKSPSDQELMDRWKLEHPRLESPAQVWRDSPDGRAVLFIDPPLATYQFYEEPNLDPKASQPYWRLSGYKQGVDFKDENGKWGRIPATPWKQEPISQLKARYGLTWRGIHRPHDRENGIAGGEIIAYDIKTNEVLAVFRNYAYTGRMQNTPDGVWWLTSAGCRKVFHANDIADAGLYRRTSSVLIPAK